jgi:hypothetical protein
VPQHSPERWTDFQSCRAAARSPPVSRLRYATKREGLPGKAPATGTGAGAGAGTLMSLLVDGARNLPFLEHSPGTVVVHVTPSPSDPPQRLGSVPYANITRPARPSRLPHARRSRCSARGTAPPRSWAPSPRPRGPPRASCRPLRSRCGAAPHARRCSGTRSLRRPGAVMQVMSPDHEDLLLTVPPCHRIPLPWNCCVTAHPYSGAAAPATTA